MLKKIDFILWASKLSLSQKAQHCISVIRESEPSRRVKSSKGATSGRFPSRKMGITIQFESHKNELAYIYELEQDKQVLEYYDQPPAIPLKYKSASGRQIGFNHTSDFFVIKEDWAGWVECKTEEQLLELTVKQPNRYCRDENGVWNCPPGEQYASQLGLDYKVWSSKSINRVFQRNIQYLEDYFRRNSPLVDDTTKRVIFTQIECKLGITLQELYEQLEKTCERDEILALIAEEKIFVDLYDSALSEPDLVKVFVNKESAQAYSNIFQINLPLFERKIQPQIVDVEVGKSVTWDGKVWRIANLGNTNITLVDNFSSSSDVPAQIFEELVRVGKITNASTSSINGFHSIYTEKIKSASKEDLDEANIRQEIVQAYLNELPLPFSVPDRTLQRWAFSYQQAKRVWGYGYLGLLPSPRIGNTSDKLPLESRKLLQIFILESYETFKQKRKNIVYGEYKLACEAKGIEPASYKTFIKEVNKRPRDLQTLKRRGRRAAYQEEPFYWCLQRDTPRHGEHPFHIVHIDYTEIDLETVDSYTGKKMGKVWLGLAISASTRRILAVYISYDDPSRSSDMMLIREILRRYGRMPQIIVVDGGHNFESIYFETLLAFFECTKKTRPPAEPRVGSIVERIFGTINTQFFHNLLGNTQIMKLVRQVTKSVHPKNHAVWTLSKLWDYLCVYCFEIYDKIEHPALGQSPRAEFELQMQLHGQRSHRLICYDENLRLLTLPTTKKGDAKVVPNLGIKINYIYYWAELFRHPEVENIRVDLRFDPFDIGKAYAYVQDKWIECYSDHYNVFSGRSEKFLKLATEELRQRKKLHAKNFSITASDIASFIQSAEAEEVLLFQQLADNQQKYILQQINNEPTSIFKEIPSQSLAADNPTTKPISPIKELPVNIDPIIPETYKTFEEAFNV